MRWPGRVQNQGPTWVLLVLWTLLTGAGGIFWFGDSVRWAAVVCTACLHGATPPPTSCGTLAGAPTLASSPLFGTSLSHGWPSNSTRLSDWSRAGYMSGSLSIPTPRVTINARTAGAKGDGVTDDTAALQAAINTAAARGGGVIYLPAGKYIVSSPLLISNSNIVIRGQGLEKTTIYIPRSLSDWKQGTWTIDPAGNIKSAWSFGGAFIQVGGTLGWG